MLHGPDAIPQGLVDRIRAFIDDRIAAAPLGRTATPAEMAPLLDGVITAEGLGPDLAWERFVAGVPARNVGLDSERFLAFTLEADR